MAEKKGHGEKQSRLQELAIVNLLTQPTITDAAQNTGVNERTLYRWMKEEEFREKYDNARKQMVNQALVYLQSLTGKATKKLEEIIDDNNTPANVKVSAIRTVLDNVVKIKELQEIEQELENLKQQIGEKEVK